MEGEQDARPSEQAVVLEFDPFIACLKANASDSHVSLQHLSLGKHWPPPNCTNETL